MALPTSRCRPRCSESRYLCGARRGLQPLPSAPTRRRWTRRRFLRAKTLEMRQRHQKYEDTPYSLEPNCKESPGGLRDLQVVIWVARAAGLGRTWQQLAGERPDHAVRGRASCSATRGMLKLIRARLHTIAGRREDRLVFDLQTAVAESFGYQARPAGSAPPRRLMRRYYWAAKAVTQLNQILMLNIEERITGLAGRADAADQREVPRARRHARGRERRPLPARPARDPRDLPGLPADGRTEGPLGAHPARALQRARPDGREVPPRPGRTARPS